MTLNVRSQTVGYAAAVAIPVGITSAVAWLGWPPFIFEHLVVLLRRRHRASLRGGPGDRGGSDIRRRRQQREAGVAATVTRPVSI
jgi:hypothetical protein